MLATLSGLIVEKPMTWDSCWKTGRRGGACGERLGCIGRRQTREGAQSATYKYIYQEDEVMSGMNGR